jgi:hypothetical protein
VQERASSPLASVVGAMRNIRTLGSVFGMSILVDYIFVKSERAERSKSPKSDA